MNGVMLPPMAERTPMFDAVLASLATFLVRYCRYLGERDFRFE